MNILRALKEAPASTPYHFHLQPSQELWLILCPVLGEEGWP
jgi:hypothetical protein